MQEDRAGQDERPDEEEHQRIGERGEHLLCRGDLQQHAGGGAEESGDGERERLGHPEDHHGGEDRGQTVRRRREPWQRERQQEEEDEGGEDAPDSGPHWSRSWDERLGNSGPR